MKAWSLYLSVALLLATVSAAAADGLAEGRKLAQKHCAVCHVVGEFNKFGGICSTPSFQMLASMKDGKERFQSFFARRPHPSFIFLPDQAPPAAAKSHNCQPEILGDPGCQGELRQVGLS